MDKKKAIAWIISAAIVGLITFIGIKTGGGPQLFEGDKIEKRTCRRCEGSGQREGGRCKACLGAKEVQVIVPGPERPVFVRGSLRDRSAFASQEKAAEAAAEEAAKDTVTLTPVEGAVRNAPIHLKRSDGIEFEFVSKATGRFRFPIPPGDYTITVEAPGYTKLEQEFTVPVRTLPIWQEGGSFELPEEEVNENAVPLTLFLEPGS